MTLPISQLLSPFSRLFKSSILEKSYQQRQTRIPNKLLLLLRPLTTALLISLVICAHFHSLSLYNHLSKTLHLIVILAVVSIPMPWPTLQNTIFAFLLWAIQLLVSSDLSLISDQDNKILMFFFGYAIGAIEVVVIYFIKNAYYRFPVQVIFAVTKILNFSSQITTDPSIIIIVIGVALILLTLSIYHDILEREHFKDIFDSRGELAKFQKILEDDFPMSVMIASADLKRAFYNNKYFAQNFLQSSHLLDIHESIEVLFKRILLEFDETNRQTSHDLTKISLYTFITEIMGSHQGVANIYSLSQDHKVTQHHYEIKIQKTSWENNLAFLIIFNDVSENQKTTALQEADRQRDRVIATITHELKTPINGILGLLDIVSSQIQDLNTKTYLEHCKNCSKLLLYQVNSIMDLSQLRQNSLQVEKSIFNLNEFLQEIQSLYTFISDHRGLQFIIEKPPELPNYIYTDKYRLISILLQLIGNAMKFTFKGFVKLRVEISPNNPQKLIFLVEDSGVGIKEEDKIQLFNMFGQIASKKKNINKQGAGLGITVANELVGILNYASKKRENIKCQSEFGKGSRFKFKIDSVPDDAAKSHYLTRVDSFAENTLAEREIGSDLLSSSIKALERNILIKRQGLNVTSKGGLQPQDILTSAENKKKVLIVDDNPLNLVAASFIVSKLGLQASTAANGSEAIKMLQESFALGQHYTFVLMDIQMPIMDGIEATKIISQMMKAGDLYKIPIIALTAKKIDNQERKIYKDCGMFDALGKPLIEQELNHILRKIPEL